MTALSSQRVISILSILPGFQKIKPITKISFGASVLKHASGFCRVICNVNGLNQLEQKCGVFSFKTNSIIVPVQYHTIHMINDDFFAVSYCGLIYSIFSVKKQQLVPGVKAGRIEGIFPGTNICVLQNQSYQNFLSLEDEKIISGSWSPYSLIATVENSPYYIFGRLGQLGVAFFDWENKEDQNGIRIIVPIEYKDIFPVYFSDDIFLVRDNKSWGFFYVDSQQFVSVDESLKSKIHVFSDNLIFIEDIEYSGGGRFFFVKHKQFLEF